MLIASSFPFLEVFWTILVFFAFLIWLSLLFLVFADLFGRNDQSGAAKVAWVLLLVLVPYVGVFIYLIAEHNMIGDRTYDEQQPSSVTPEEKSFAEQ